MPNQQCYYFSQPSECPPHSKDIPCHMGQSTPILNTCCPPSCSWVSKPGLPGCGNPNPSTRLNSCRHSRELALGMCPSSARVWGRDGEEMQLHRDLLSCSAEGVPSCKVIILPLGGGASKHASFSMFCCNYISVEITCSKLRKWQGA